MRVQMRMVLAALIFFAGIGGPAGVAQTPASAAGPGQDSGKVASKPEAKPICGVLQPGLNSVQQARDAYERDYILKKLEEAKANVSRAAELLGLERSHLYRKMKALGIAARE